MGTNAIVASTSVQDGKQGRYVHYDGQPDHMVPELVRIVNQFGFEEASRTLVLLNVGWSYLHDGTPALSRPSHVAYLDGYGDYYTDGEGYWGNPADAEWGYLLTEKYVLVLAHGQPTHRAYYSGTFAGPDGPDPLPAISWKAADHA